jgi:hypothetical protein
MILKKLLKQERNVHDGNLPRDKKCNYYYNNKKEKFNTNTTPP